MNAKPTLARPRVVTTLVAAALSTSSPSGCSPPSPAYSSATAPHLSKSSSPSTPAPIMRSYPSARLRAFIPRHITRPERRESLKLYPAILEPGRRRRT